MKKYLALLAMVLLTGCMTTGDPRLDGQLSNSQAYFSSTPFTAMVDFHVHSNHHVYPDGKPVSGKKQSKRIGGKGLLTKKYAVARGGQGYIFSMGLKNDRVLAMAVSTQQGGMSAAWNPSNIYVYYPRPITEADLTKESIARAVSSLLVFKGMEPGSELDDLLDELDQPKSE
jgi:hypothetical protein